MLETPIMTLHRPGPNKPFLPDAVQAAFDSLTLADKKRFLSLSGNGRPEATTNLLRIFLTNALGGINNDISSICIEISLLNHSCVPNATWCFRPDAATGGSGKYLITATSTSSRTRRSASHMPVTACTSQPSSVPQSCGKTGTFVVNVAHASQALPSRKPATSDASCTMPPRASSSGTIVLSPCRCQINNTRSPRRAGGNSFR